MGINVGAKCFASAHRYAAHEGKDTDGENKNGDNVTINQISKSRTDFA